MNDQIQAAIHEIEQALARLKSPNVMWDADSLMDLQTAATLLTDAADACAED